MKLIFHARTGRETGILSLLTKGILRGEERRSEFSYVFSITSKGMESLLCPRRKYFRIVDKWRNYFSKFGETAGGTVEFMTEGKRKGN